MTPDANEWEIESLQKRYRETDNLDLTYEQARRVYDFEQQRDTPSDSHYFSFWEELDFQLTAFQQILTIEQLDSYISHRKNLIEFNEKGFVEQDKGYIEQINRLNEIVRYYEDTFLPGIIKEPLLLSFFGQEQPKFDFLKAEYKRFLNNSKKAILVNHFRNHRTFQPNLLKLSLLHLSLSYLFPDYLSFKRSMDEATRAVADYLTNRFAAVSLGKTQVLKKKLQDLEQFSTEATKKHMGKISGWHVTPPAPGIPENEYLFMCLALFDRNKYRDRVST